MADLRLLVNIAAQTAKRSILAPGCFTTTETIKVHLAHDNHKPHRLSM